MKKPLLLSLLPLSLSILSGCASNKVRDLHFRKYGSIVSDEYFSLQLESKLEQLNKMFYLNDDYPRKNISVSYMIDGFGNYNTSEPAAYTIHALQEGKMKIDLFNKRFELESITKLYVKNILNSSENIALQGLKEGINRQKTHLYGEQNGNQMVLIDLDYRTLDFSSNVDNMLGYLPYSISEEIFSFSARENSNIATTAYMNGTNIFTYVARETSKSGSSGQSGEEAIQFIFDSGVKILYKNSISTTSSSSYYDSNSSIEVTIKPFNGNVKKVNYNNYQTKVIE